MPDLHNNYEHQKSTADQILAETVVGTTSILLFQVRQCYHVMLSSGMRERCGRKRKGGQNSFDFWVARLAAR